ncbi:hypothetical protein ABZ845_11805 [Streptomyces sp. NPDC047022]|uniref:hypothetical protein n=1 Tax=Streptomyces sp. NPDC047022 TaxID=3155737 RepID=UPI0033DFF238
MAVVLSMRWDGVTPEQYEAVRDLVRWEEHWAEGSVLHVAWFEGGALRVVDVWDSQEHFEHFMRDRLEAGVAKAGITGAPEVAFWPLHRRMVAPGVTGAAS